MGCLYIGGSQCKTGAFKDEDDWESFDAKKKELKALATESNVEIDRRGVGEDGHCFVIANKTTPFNCFYEEEAFDYDMKLVRNKIPLLCHFMILHEE